MRLKVLFNVASEQCLLIESPVGGGLKVQRVAGEMAG
jgi:hypothetical protein